MNSNKIGIVLAVAAFSMISGCGQASASYGANLTAYNHSLSAVSSYSVKINGGDATGAGFLSAGSGGGGMTCCVQVPRNWSKGMTATVTAHFDSDEVSKQVTKVVPIPEYRRNSSNVMVHFLYNGGVRVFVTDYFLGHRNYPLSGKDAELKPGVPIKIIWE